jgi:acetyl coenzyme A synthetase (ADP forming)-like protein
MSLDGFFRPQSIAILGVSRNRGSLSGKFFDALVKYNFQGNLFPVNPRAAEIGGIPCYPSVDSIPVVPALGIILVPKEIALEAVESCGKKGIKNILMITAGFREVGGEGIKREKQLVQMIRKYDIRMIGPNCMGIINTDPAVRLNASFSPTEPYSGNVAFISQSGALGVVVLEMCKALRLGFSFFVSVGNKVDLGERDFLEYLEYHEPTKVIVLYQESIENANHLRDVLSRITKRKPVIVLKAGRGESGAKAASSHTGALASSDLAVEAFYKQSGVIRVDSLEELFELTQTFSKQSVPRGKRVAILTNAGGPGILATDSIEKMGLKLAKFNPHTKLKLEEQLPAEASLDNPVDMIASADEKVYQAVLTVLQEDNGIDSIMVIIVRPPVNTTIRKIASNLRKPLNSSNRKPTFVVLMAQPDSTCGLEVFQDLNLPVYAYPESAVRSISAMIKYREFVEKKRKGIVEFEINTTAVKDIFEKVKREDRTYLYYSEIEEILKTYQYPLPFSRIVQTAEQAIQLQHQLKKPVVLKILSEEIIHKSAIGGVKPNLKNSNEIKKAFDYITYSALKNTTKDKINGILVQEMIKDGFEIVLGIKRDPLFGPLIMFGLGGIHIEIFKDICFRIAPLTEEDAYEMIDEIKSFKIFKEVGGITEFTKSLIAEWILRLSQLALDWPQIVELDLNPIKIFPEPESCKIVDSRIKLNLNFHGTGKGN